MPFKSVPKNEVARLHSQMDPEEAQKLGVFVSFLRKTLYRKKNNSSIAKKINKRIMNLRGMGGK